MNTYKIIFDFNGAEKNVYVSAELLGDIYGQYFIEDSDRIGFSFTDNGNRYFAMVIVDDFSLEIYDMCGVQLQEFKRIINSEHFISAVSFKIEQIKIN